MIGDDLRLPIFDPEALEAETSAMIYQVMEKRSFSSPSESRKRRASVDDAEDHGALQLCGLKLPLSPQQLWISENAVPSF
jgi:hypothetical protein